MDVLEEGGGAEELGEGFQAVLRGEGEDLEGAWVGVGDAEAAVRDHDPLFHVGEHGVVEVALGGEVLEAGVGLAEGVEQGLLKGLKGPGEGVGEGPGVGEEGGRGGEEAAPEGAEGAAEVEGVVEEEGGGEEGLEEEGEEGGEGWGEGKREGEEREGEDGEEGEEEADRPERVRPAGGGSRLPGRSGCSLVHRRASSLC